MSLVGVVLVLVVIGVALYLVSTLIPMDPRIKTIISVVVILAVLIWLLEVFGLIGPYPVRGGCGVPVVR